MLMHPRRIAHVVGGLAVAGAITFGGLTLLRLSTPTHAQAQTQAPTAQQALIVTGDMVRSGESVTAEEAPFLACTEQNRYPQGTQVVFRIKVIDPVTQQAMDPSQIQSMTLTLPDGSTAPFAYHPLNMGQSPDSAWVAVWSIPDNYPTGSVNVQIQAVDNQGRTGAWTQFDVPESQLQVVPKGQS